MDNNNSNTGLDKMILIAGLTGAELKTIYEWLHRHSKELIGLEPECIIHFEEELLKSRGNGYCLGIEQIAGIIPISREYGRKLFEDPASTLLQRLSRSNCRSSIIFIHLTYLSHGSIITNPALGVLLRSARSVDVVYLIEDLYDALDRIQARLQGKETKLHEDCQSVGLIASPFTIDPLEYITWRAADYNLLTALETFKPGLRTFLLGVKHPPETFKRLLRSIIEERPDTWGERTYMYTYASHPISVQRRLYANRLFNSLLGNPLVIAIEAFKEALIEEFNNIILFEPTTVDELLADPFRRLMEALKICSDPCDNNRAREPDENRQSCWDILNKILDRESENPELREDIAKLREKLADTVVYHSILVEWRNRWPLHKSTIYEEAARAVNKGDGYPYRSTGNRLNLVANKFSRIYGRWWGYSRLISILNFEIVEWVLPKIPRARNGEGQPVLYEKLVSHVKRQIEMRDYHYVSQSTIITVILPIVLVTRTALEGLGVEDDSELSKLSGVYYVRSSGMEAEMQRAIALARPIVVYMLPISFSLLVKASTAHGSKLIDATLRDSRVFKKCSSGDSLGSDLKSALKSIERCAENLGGLFAPTSAGVRYCLVPHMLDEDTFKEDIDRYNSYYRVVDVVKRRYRGVLASSCLPTPT